MTPYPSDNPDPARFLDSTPGENKVELGQVLSTLANRLLLEETEAHTPREIAVRLQRSQSSPDRAYADADKLAAISCRAATHGWAESRLPELDIPYRLRDQLADLAEQEKEDRQASLRLIELAEDFLRIVRFCRNIDLLEIDIGRHPAGIAIDFKATGRCSEMALRIVENKGLALTLERYASENSLKTRFHIDAASASLQAIVLRPNLRLGLSPAE